MSRQCIQCVRKFDGSLVLRYRGYGNYCTDCHRAGDALRKYWVDKGYGFASERAPLVKATAHRDRSKSGAIQRVKRAVANVARFDPSVARRLDQAVTKALAA